MLMSPLTDARRYEAFVIYTFLNLCLGYVGGAGEVEVKMNGHVLAPSVLACTCCLPPLVRRGCVDVACTVLHHIYCRPVLRQPI